MTKPGNYICAASAALLLSASACAGDLAANELRAMQSAAGAYATAWLSNDAATVMSAFVAEPVLSPSGLPYLEGQEAARAFWFPPDSPPLTVSAFELSAIEATGSGNLDYVRGTFRLIFDYAGERYENRGKYVTILRKTGGEWRITHHIWDDFPRDE